MTARAPVRNTLHRPRTIAITGGKGGVGKTSVALNLALTLARGNKRVLLLDGDTDLANVSIMVGLYPRKTLAHVIAGKSPLQDILLETDYGLHIIPGASGVQECMDMNVADSLRVLRELSQLESHYDYVIVDTAAGLQAVGLHMVAAAELACIVITPDPASLTDAFSLIKVIRRRGYKRTPSILVNMAQGASQARSVFQRLDSAAQRHLGISLHYMGGIWRDETLRQSVLNQTPVALLPVTDPSCRQFHTLADMLNVRLSQLPPGRAGIAAYWHQVSSRHQKAKAEAGSSRPASLRERWQNAVGELETVLAEMPESAMLRYEIFTRLFKLLGARLDSDTVEIIQTGLGSLAWESMDDNHRKNLAEHLRHLADDISPQQGVVSSAAQTLPALPEPVYDKVSFGEQDRLVRALKEHPADVSLDQLLRALAANERNRS
ncbi:MAG TPA: AAA family ATPase [Marinobacter sp.]|nr:AAA family ATPase [Marinobacter sp.]